MSTVKQEATQAATQAKQGGATASPSAANEGSLLDVARKAVELAKAKGAQDAAAGASRVREVEVSWRDGKLEKMGEATSRSLGLQLFVDGRYSAVSTSDLRPDALERFVQNAVAMARILAPDPHRALPDPELYKGQAAVDLELRDPAAEGIAPADRRQMVEALEAAARGVKGADRFNTVSTGWHDVVAQSARVHSNGFEGTRQESYFGFDVSVSITDTDGRRPGDYAAAASRFRSGLPSPEVIGRLAAERTLSRLGSKKGASEVLPMLVENRVAGNLVRQLFGPMSGQALQQKRSFLEGKVGQRIGSERLAIVDDPHLKRGFGSRLYDGEGMAAKRMSLFEGGTLKTYYIDNYYGRKLGMRPTTAGPSNLVWKEGEKSLEQLLKEMGEGILVTGFLGGNSNATTGDFSVGIHGFRVRKGQRAEPVAEMNVAGNHLEFWKRLAAVGNDPYPYSPMRTPTLLFEGVQFAGA